MRNFRALRRESPSLGACPLTVVDPTDLDGLARYSFAQMLQQRHRNVSSTNQNSGNSKDSRALSGGSKEGADDVGTGAGDRSTEKTNTGYNTEIDENDDVSFQQSTTMVGQNSNELVAGNVMANIGPTGEDSLVEGTSTAGALVSVKEIAAAFEDAAHKCEQQRYRGSGDLGGASGIASTGNLPHPSADTKQAKVRCHVGRDRTACIAHTLLWLVLTFRRCVWTHTQAARV